MALMIIQLLIVLGALYVGSRYGSLALGAISGIGLAILVFGFSMKPGTVSYTHLTLPTICSV